jgi:hypothetical protein
VEFDQIDADGGAGGGFVPLQGEPVVEGVEDIEVIDDPKFVILFLGLVVQLSGADRFGEAGPFGEGGLELVEGDADIPFDLALEARKIEPARGEERFVLVDPGLDAAAVEEGDFEGEEPRPIAIATAVGVVEGVVAFETEDGPVFAFGGGEAGAGRAFRLDGGEDIGPSGTFGEIAGEFEIVGQGGRSVRRLNRSEGTPMRKAIISRVASRSPRVRAVATRLWARELRAWRSSLSRDLPRRTRFSNSATRSPRAVSIPVRRRRSSS